jgi:hypothetical protein
MSMERRCDFIRANDLKWYLVLGENEHDYDDDDCLNYGPFDTEEQADDYLIEHFSNPGFSITDNSCVQDPPSPLEPMVKSWGVRGDRVDLTNLFRN